MTVISMFYGIIVSIYYLDNKQHNLPHLHAKYQENEIIISIPDGNVLDGNFPINKMKILQAWIEIHRDELVADWELAVNGNNVFPIEPLK